MSGVRKLTREEVMRDPNAIAKVRIVYDDGETHWGLVRRDKRESCLSGFKAAGQDDGSEAVVDTLSDRTMRLFVGRAPAIPEKKPFQDFGHVKTAQVLANATHLSAQSDTSTTAQACRDLATLGVPAACGRVWGELSTVERQAALGLGWTPQLWKNLWTGCQRGQPLTLVPQPTLTRKPNLKCDADGTQDLTESTKRQCVGTMTTVLTASVSVQTLPVARSFGVASLVDLATTCNNCSGASAVSCQSSSDTQRHVSLSFANSVSVPEADTASSDCSPPGRQPQQDSLLGLGYITAGVAAAKPDRTLQQELTRKLQTIEAERKQVISGLKQAHVQRMHAEESSVRLDHQRSMGIFDSKQNTERKKLQVQHELSVRQLVQGKLPEAPSHLFVQKAHIRDCSRGALSKIWRV